LTAPERDTGEFDAVELESSPTEYQVAERHMFGLAPTAFVAALAGACLVAAIVLFAIGSIVVAVLVLLAAIFLATLFVEQARRRRTSPLDRAAAGAIESSLALAGFAGASVRAWTGAGREVTALRLEAKRLTHERSKVQYALGAAAAGDDAAETERLRTELRSLDDRIAGCAKRAQAAVGNARKSTTRERLAVSSTQIKRP
jgi:membrane protein implicated in regulation of membrane protease activity